MKPIVLSCFLILSIICTWSQTASGQFAAVSGTEVAVYLHVEPHPALQASQVARIETRVLSMVRTMLGIRAKVDLVRIPKLNRWLESRALDQLNAEHCRNLGCDGSEKTVLLSLAYRRGTYYLTGAEYDKHFDSFGPVHRQHIVQPGTLQDAVGRLAIKCWTPVGTIAKAKDEMFSITFSDLPRLNRVPNWSRIRAGSILQVYREVFQTSTIQQSAHRSQFLMIRSVSDTEVWAGPLGDSWDKAWFDLLEHPQTRYLVRRVSPIPGASKVRVFVSGQIENRPAVLVPRAGCDVFVTDSPPVGAKIWEKPIGETNREGFANIDVSSDAPVFVSVAYEDRISTRPLVRGVTPEPLTFEFSYDRNRTSYLTSLRWVHDDVRTRKSQINGLIETINKTAKSGDSGVIDGLYAQIQKLGNTDDLEQRMESVLALAAKDNVDVTSFAKDVTTELELLQRDVAKVEKTMTETTAFVAVQGELKKVQEQFDNLQWAAALASLEAIAAENPDQPEVNKLPGFRKAMQTVDETHAQARKVLSDSIGATRFQTLSDRWSQIRDALQNLLTNQDALYLATVNAELDGWVRLLNEEISEILTANAANPSRSDALKLQARGKKASEMKKDLERLRPLIFAGAEKAKQIF